MHKIIHIDVDAAEINKNIQVDLGIIGDAKCILNELNNKLERTKSSTMVKTNSRFKRSLSINL